MNSNEVRIGGGRYSLEEVFNMRHIGIFPGTFDPVHFGHIEFAKKVLDDERLNMVLFLPHIYASKNRVSELEDRQLMLEEQLFPDSRIGVLNLSREFQNEFSRDDFMIGIKTYLESQGHNPVLYRLFGIDRLESVNLDLFEENFCGSRGLPHSKVSNERLKFINTPYVSSSQVRDKVVPIETRIKELVKRRRKINADFAYGLAGNL